MAYGGISYNNSGNAKSGMSGRFRCVVCNREYKQVWTKSIHERLCKDREEKEE